MNDIHNKELYDKCKVFVKKSTDQIYPKIPSRAYQVEFELLIEISKLSPEFQKLSEYEELKECVKRDEKISSQLNVLVGNRHGKSRIELNPILEYFIRESCNQFRLKNKFDEEEFDRLYNNIEGFFYNDAIPMVRKIFVKNANGNSILRLPNNITIRPIDLNEQKFFQDRMSFGLLGHMEFSFSHVIEQITYEKKLIGDQHAEPLKQGENPWDVLEKVIIALRLFKPGEFSATFRMSSSALDGPVNGGTMYSIGSIGGPRSHSENYLFTGSDGEEFKKFWEKFLASKYHQSKSIDIAIRRFNLAYDRSNLDDKIIDFLISYEALFFKNEKQEMNEKLSRRVSRLLESEFDRRRLVFKEMKEIYQKRSSIIHGDEASITEPFVQRVEEILRMSIKEFLERLNTQNHDQIIDHLDFD